MSSGNTNLSTRVYTSEYDTSTLGLEQEEDLRTVNKEFEKVGKHNGLTEGVADADACTARWKNHSTVPATFVVRHTKLLSL